MLIYEMQLQKVTIKILLFYLIKNESHFKGKGPDSNPNFAHLAK